MSKDSFEKFESSNLRIEDLKILGDFRTRRDTLNKFLSQHSINLFSCPSCGYPTLTERDGYEICRVCNWEDDGQDDKEADEIWGGPNYQLSLTESRLNIGRQLKDIAEKVNGEIDGSPQNIVRILSEHDNTIKNILNNLPEEADLDHPFVKEYNEAGQELLYKLVKK